MRGPSGDERACDGGRAVVRCLCGSVTGYGMPDGRGAGSMNGLGWDQRSGGAAVHDRPRDSSVEEVLDLHDAQVDRLLAYLCAADRSLTHLDAENIARQALLEQRNRPRAGQPDEAAVTLFVAAQRAAAASGASRTSGPNALTESIAPWPDHPAVVRLLVLQDGLDRLSPTERQVVLLRELCKVSAADTARIADLPEPGVEAARADALRALVPMLEQGVGSRPARAGALS